MDMKNEAKMDLEPLEGNQRENECLEKTCESKQVKEDNDTTSTSTSTTGMKQDNNSSDNNNGKVYDVPSSSANKEDTDDGGEEEEDKDNELKTFVDKDTKPGRSEGFKSSNVKEETSKSKSPSSPVVKNVKMRKSKDYTDDKKSLYSSSASIYSTFPMSEDFSVSTNGENSIKITGYLEKRSKMLGWKKYWFVLDGRLLTYYKSKSEYESLSACCGSINLGIASTVRPIQIRGCKGYPIQVVTRTQVYYLRSLDKQILDQWLIAIQESASSQPKISLPVWSDPGSQFFRYSFAALSQWSLDASTEDITESLSTLPQNFYLKRGGPTRQPNHLHKCHSFASLQSPSAYSAMSLKDTINNNNSVKMRTKKEAIPGQTNKVRQSTSMLMLESSTQAAELRKELARKLSVGTTPEKSSKPILSTAKSKSELLFLKTPHKDNPDDELHHYDEIVDIEAIYENYENEEDGSSSEGLNRHSPSEHNDAGIYESVETMLENPWDKIDPDTNTMTSTRNNDRNSGSKRNSLVSNTDDSINKHSVPRLFPALPDPPPSSRRGTGTSIDSDTSSNYSYGDVSSTMEKPGKKWKSKPFGSFFHKIFHKDKGKKPKVTPPLVITGPVDLRSLHHQSQQSPVNRPTNLPIDKDSDGCSTLTKSHQFVGSKSAFNNENVMDELKIKVDQRNRIAPKPNAKPSLSPKYSSDKPNLRTPVIPTPLLVEKLAIKSGQISLEKTTIPSAEQNPEKIEDKNRPENIAISTERLSQRRQSSEDFQKKLAKFNTLSQRLNSSFTAALNPAPVILPTVGPLGRSHSYRVPKSGQQMRDDKSPPLPPKKKNNPSTAKPSYYDYPTNNQPVSRQSSADDEDPSGENKNSRDIKKAMKSDSDILPATFIRSLQKKNSAPDSIIFSSSRSSSGESGTNSKDGKDVDNVFEEFLSPPPPIPPKLKSPTSSPSLNRSFETSTSAHYKVPPNRNTFNKILSNDSNEFSVTDNDQNSKMPNNNLLSCDVKLSPPISHKSADLDTLEGLSDFSDTNASISPPESPKESQSNKKITDDPISEEQDSLISISVSSESATGFATDSLSTTLDNRQTPQNLAEYQNKKKEQDDQNNLQIFIHANQGDSPFPVKTRDELDSLDASSLSSHCHSEADSIYENLRFATMNTLVQEFETVEETEDEISEMYDDFPTEFLTAVNLTGYSNLDSSSDSPTSPSNSSSTPSPSSEDKITCPTDSIRHSGIDQLQEYLRMESNSLISNDDFNPDEDSSNNPTPDFNKGPLRPGAVSRLGHSSAVDQLQRVLRTRSDV